MSIIWRLYALLLVLGVYQIMTSPSLSFPTSHMEPRRHRTRNAYLTLLCDDIMAEATMVMVHSLKKTKTPHDVIVLSYRVSNATLESLRALGAIIENVTTPVPYPFAVTADRLAINKPCRYSKILMWNMLQYNKIIYMDSDLLVVDNVDELFERPQLTAVPDTLPPDKFNSGLMVIEPSRATFRDMLSKVATLLSPNVGDQGFLNSYFSNWYKLPRIHHLEYGYNALVRISSSPAWKEFIEPSLKVLHFSGSTKPWNTMVDKQFPTTRSYDWMWWQVYQEVYETLEAKMGAVKQEARSMLGVSDETEEVGMAIVDPVEGPEQVGEEHGKSDLERMPKISISGQIWGKPPQLHPQCARDFMAFQRGHLIKDKLTVVMNSFDRFTLLTYMVQRYASMEFVHKIYIVWGNTNVTPFHPSYFNITKPLEILYTGNDSLNDRFRPIRTLETECVLLCDDDIQVQRNALQTAFHRWQDDKYRLVGFFPRAHYRDPKTKQLVYVFNPKQEYSIVLTKMFLVHADYFRSYTCLMPEIVRAYVDNYKNCEDIAMNFLVTQLSGSPPLLVEDSSKVDFGTTSGLSNRSSHDLSRSVCMNDIEVMLGYMSLRNTSEAAVFFDKDHSLKIPISRQLGEQIDIQSFPVYDSSAPTASGGLFMSRLPLSERRGRMEVGSAPSHALAGRILCVTGNNAGQPGLPPNRYSLLEYSDVPYNAVQLSGTTFVVHTSGMFEGRFMVPALMTNFINWRKQHGCFAPSRLLIYNDALIQTSLSPWTLSVSRAVLGPRALPFTPSSPRDPVCLSDAFVVRMSPPTQTSECPEGLQEVRRTIVRHCQLTANNKKGLVPFAGAPDTVQIAVAGDVNKFRWFNYSGIARGIRQDCDRLKLKCNVGRMPKGDFCTIKVMGFSRVDIMVGPWGDRALDNIMFLRPGAALLEFASAPIAPHLAAAARTGMQCHGITYEILSGNDDNKAVATWIRSHALRLRNDGRPKPDGGEPVGLETCVARTIIA